MSDTWMLPGGYVDERGRVHREVEVAPMTGRDEEELLSGAAPDSHAEAGSAAAVTALLTRCVARIGAIAPVTTDVARGLLVADRQFLLLKIREATFGQSVRSSISCPLAECGSRIDVVFGTDAVPVVESTEKGPRHPMTLDAADVAVDEHGETHRDLTFRLPNGADQEELSPLLHRNAAAALTGLLERCVTSIGPFSPPPARLVGGLSPAARRTIERRMEDLAPQVDLTMESTCPECGQTYSVPWDIQSFLFGEIRVNAELLHHEVHYLAFHYHWSEREILEMPRQRRRHYVERLAEEIERFDDDR
jgi:hypothetical protein